MTTPTRTIQVLAIQPSPEAENIRARVDAIMDDVRRQMDAQREAILIDARQHAEPFVAVYFGPETSRLGGESGYVMTFDQPSYVLRGASEDEIAQQLRVVATPGLDGLLYWVRHADASRHTHRTFEEFIAAKQADD